MPLPGRLAALLVELAGQLTATAADAPLAALRAAGVLERVAAWVGRTAAGALCDDGMPAEAVATALGTTGTGRVTARTPASALLGFGYAGGPPRPGGGAGFPAHRQM
ncbi:hypothetical protein [Streptomyces sp. NBC_00207]|uniref:hypothetical protein n=1 Tax=unclassified Streptomyces TaxID=2593676 RepID=UPI002884FA6B|nr:hypothetical protein [Streptomyces sp. DSM 41633]